MRKNQKRKTSKFNSKMELNLNRKKTKLVTKNRATSLRTVNGDTEVIGSV